MLGSTQPLLVVDRKEKPDSCCILDVTINRNSMRAYVESAQCGMKQRRQPSHSVDMRQGDG